MPATPNRQGHAPAGAQGGEGPALEGQSLQVNPGMEGGARAKKGPHKQSRGRRLSVAASAQGCGRSHSQPQALLGARPEAGKRMESQGGSVGGVPKLSQGRPQFSEHEPTITSECWIPLWALTSLSTSWGGWHRLLGANPVSIFPS